MIYTVKEWKKENSEPEQEQAKRQTKRQHQSQPSELGFLCEQCQRQFRRSGDRKCHKCSGVSQVCSAGEQYSYN